MSGGISAIRGFDYQATVILELLFDHFDDHGSNASARPEGNDDLDLKWTVDGVDSRRFIQVKKPTENLEALPNPSPWGLREILRELLPDAITRLTGNDYRQSWVLGDAVSSAARGLFGASDEASVLTDKSYWPLIHGLARAASRKLLPEGSAVASPASRWAAEGTLPTDPTQAKKAMDDFADAFRRQHGSESAAFIERYLEEVWRLHSLLPGILRRITIVDENGTEAEVAERVMRRLETRYGLQRPVIEASLFRNLRGFINDIAKQPARFLGREELEMEIRSVWPCMIPIKDPPPLEAGHLMRPALTTSLLHDSTTGALEVIGISGSGKTRLAAEVLERSLRIDPARITLYAEVRSNVSLRDCLVGTAFHLRRLGIPGPFAAAVQPSETDEKILNDLAKALTAVPNNCLLLVDLVDGSEPPGFARDIAAFVRAITSRTFRIIAFGQESILRQLTTLERGQLGVHSVAAPGLSFEEFAILVGQLQSPLDRARLLRVYQQITAGRSSGLNVSLTRALAQAPSMEAIEEIASRPAEDRLAYAERQRFTRVSTHAQAAAGKLICFALPFERTEAEGVFPDDNVGLAIRELFDLGLLRRHDGQAFEMHETVRAGLETLIAPGKRREADDALAAWYQATGQIEAAIFHLEKAGQSSEAQSHARQAFLSGAAWRALWPYVTRHQLVSTDEVIDLIRAPKPIADAYLLREVLKELKDPPLAGDLLAILEEQSDRALEDYVWARPILETILAQEPSRLDDLIDLFVRRASTAKVAANALQWLFIAAFRTSSTVGPNTLALFDVQPEMIQKPLLNLLLQGGPIGLRHALKHICEHPGLVESGGGFTYSLSLNTRRPEDIVDVLMALPAAKPADMIRTRSPRFGVLGKLVWGARRALRPACISALQAQVLDSDALINAIRILIFLGEPMTLELCEGLRSRSDLAGSFAGLVPAVVPALVDWSAYEGRVLNLSSSLSDRGLALMTLAASGAPLDGLLERLREAEPDSWPKWTHFLTLILVTRPFAAGLSILRAELEAQGTSNEKLRLALAVQARVPGRDATNVLVQALKHGDATVRMTAALGLARRRDRAALAPLVEAYRAEELPQVQTVLAPAILASGSTSAADLSSHSGTPATDLWWCVLAHRARDLSAAGRLVAIASDPTQTWMVRRSAINAAGRLPYETALARIEPVIMVGPLPPMSPALHQTFNAIDRHILEAATLRALRLCGRPDRIEAHLATADSAWLAITALLEIHKLPERGPALSDRLRASVSKTEWAEERVVNKLLSELSEPPSVTRPMAVPTVHAQIPKSTVEPLSYAAAVRLLSGSAEVPLPNEPIVLESLTAEECSTLIRMADPSADLVRGETTYIPAISFTQDGHLVTRSQTTYRGEPFPPDRLRPAIAAANTFGLPIPWHAALLEGPLGETYGYGFLKCLAAKGDSALFYAELKKWGDVLVPILCMKAQELSAQLELDLRLLPFLTQVLAVGGDEFFKGMCLLAKRIESAKVVPILEVLLHRFVQRFDIQAKETQNDAAYDLWHGFTRLTEHPHFGSIYEWHQQLETVLTAPMRPYHAESIVRVLERDPESYLTIETRLFREFSFEHFHEGEIDRLDRVAETLFLSIKKRSDQPEDNSGINPENVEIGSPE